MCVIMLVTEDKRRPNDIMIAKAWQKNPDGGGIAWREKDKHGKTVVRWKKGLEEEEWADLVRKVPAPYVAHARIASSEGGIVCEELTHPIPVQEDVSLALEGTTKRGVLFHNGNWKEWPNEIRMALYGGKMKEVPPGLWNDTRTMAFMTYFYGDKFMEFLPTQRGIMFKPEGWEIFSGPGWKELNGTWCSNDLFIHIQTPTVRGHQGPYLGPGGSQSEPVHRPVGNNPIFCNVLSCNRRDLNPLGWCPDHETPASRTRDITPITIEKDDNRPAVILAPDGKPTGTQEVSGASPIPFRQLATRIIYSPALIKEMLDQKRMSKSLFKDLLSAHEMIQGQNMKKREKGYRILKAISESKNLDQRLRPVM